MPRVPGAPTAVLAQARAHGALVQWTPPANTGSSAITSYTVTASPGGTTTVSSGTSLAVTGLANGTAYTFTVRATNAWGSGEDSAPSAPITTPDAPGAPGEPHAVADVRSATLTWAAPDPHGDPVQEYTVRVQPDAPRSATVVSGTQAVVTGLDDATTYTFTVSARNALGEGPAATFPAVTTPVATPAAPGDVRATVSGAGRVTVSWQAPYANGGKPLTGYAVTASPGGATVSTAPTETTATFTGLGPGTAYTFTVRASNEVGLGTASQPSAPVTTPDVPAAPTSVSVMAGGSRATVSWRAPVSGGENPVTGYTVAVSPGNITADISGNRTTAVVQGLVASTSYSFTVRAKNAVGTGRPSAPVTARPPASCGRLGFPTLPLLPTQETPAAMLTADFNADGKPDLAWVGHGGVRVLLGKGGGAFEDEKDSATTTRPAAVVTVDLDKDGHQDLVTVDDFNDELRLLSGEGDGTFPVSVGVHIGDQPLGVAVADFDADGWLDVMTANQGSNTSSLLLKAGDLLTARLLTIPTGVGARAVLTGDFNRDGRQDFATANATDQTVSVHLGNGDGTFAARKDFATGASAWALTAGDFNEDGRQDFATSNFGNDTVSVLLGNGDGTFGAASSLGTLIWPRAVTARDLDGDGHQDLVVTVYAGISVLPGKGDGTFAARRDFKHGLSAVDLALADFNSDGRLDVAVAYQYAKGIGLLLGNGGGTFSVWKNYATGAEPLSVASADFNGDGVPDLVSANSAASSVSVLTGTGDGAFGGRRDYVTQRSPAYVLPGDLDNDGKVDLLAYDGFSTVASVLAGHGDGVFDAPLGFYLWPYRVLLEDVSGDGKLDLIAANAGGAQLQLGRGDRTFTDLKYLDAGHTANAVAVADFNNDGLLDIAAADDLDKSVRVLMGTGNGAFSSAKRTPTPGVFKLVAADLDADGRMDLVAGTRLQDSVLRVLLGQGDGTFVVKAQYPVGYSPDNLSVADLNGDGRADLLFTADDGRDVITTLMGQGDGTFGERMDLLAGHISEFTPVDVNGDGRMDLAVADRYAGAVSILPTTCVAP
ncbi:FG-GAP-like repeat-containing protein [Pyxidicoccus caerfyrddinensis]|uniref:FG-GAP-like repeat-containing protein n=1 Tax=Pyxidicoccus caerfyrddinensis TaxID=2709663 RepID=UPI0013DA6829|nr:FG-GAP-like repeat-containing protein [Pyxidicoccus caerfyrddinensis]